MAVPIVSPDRRAPRIMDKGHGGAGLRYDQSAGMALFKALYPEARRDCHDAADRKSVV